MQFNEKLKKLRLKKGISQAELAKKIFVSRSAVAKWENGLGLPSDESFKLLVNFFGVKDEELYSDKITEAVIVKKNLTISKTRKLFIIASIVYLLIVLTFISTQAELSGGCRSCASDKSTIAGIYASIILPDEEDIYSKTLAGNTTTIDNCYSLRVGETYHLAMKFIVSGKKERPALISRGDISLLYDDEVLEIAYVPNESLEVMRYEFICKSKVNISAITVEVCENHTKKHGCSLIIGSYAP